MRDAYSNIKARRTKEGDAWHFHGLIPKTLPASMGTIYDNMNLAWGDSWNL